MPRALERDAERAENLRVRPQERARQVVFTGLALPAPVDGEARERRILRVGVPRLRGLGELGRPFLDGERQERREKVVEARKVGARPGERDVFVAGENGRREAPLQPEEARREAERLGDERGRGEQDGGAGRALLERHGRIERRVHACTLSPGRPKRKSRGAGTNGFDLAYTSGRAMRQNQSEAGARRAWRPGSRLVSALELLVGSAIVIGHNVFQVLPNEVPILAVLGLVSFRMRGGGWRRCRSGARTPGAASS